MATSRYEGYQDLTSSSEVGLEREMETIKSGKALPFDTEVTEGEVTAMDIPSAYDEAARLGINLDTYLED